MADEDESACNLSGRKRKRGLAAIEPPEFVGDTKTCPNPECGSTEHCVFKYLNNGKPDQPRYRCLRCNHMHTHYPPGKERPRPHVKTYTKHTLANPPEHRDLFDLRCPNPACGPENRQPRFLYYNNKKRLQPRYRCLVCDVPWQPKLKSKLPALPDDLLAPTQAEYDHNVHSCNYIDSAAPIHMQEFVPPQELYYNPEDPANLGPGDPNYMAVMQYSQLQQPYDYPADQFVNVGSCTELYPSGDPNYIQDVMQGSQLQQQPYLEVSQDQYYVNSFGCTHHDPTINYISTLQASDPSGHVTVQAGDQEQLCHPEERLASSDTFHVNANAVEAGEEQYAVYPELDPALSSGIYTVDAPQDTDEWISELFAVNG